MRVSSIIPNAGPAIAELGLAEMARVAEDAGADGVWVSDHLLMVDDGGEGYPYSTTGRATWRPDVDYYEAFACLAFMAAATTTARVGTAALVLPQRHVLELAKVTATLDRLSGGRLVLGVGAGWYRAEFEALGYGFQTRGRRFDEMLPALRSCWTGRPEAVAGEEVRIPDGVIMQPTPKQPGGPPLLVGGMTPRALRRAARHGDGWLALTYVDRLDPQALRASLDELRTLRADAGREPPATTIVLHSRPETAAQVPDGLRELAALGFDEAIVDPPWASGLDAGSRFIAEARSAV